MAHSLNTSFPRPSGPNQPNLETEEIWQARVDLAACFRMAARYGLEEGICNHFSALVPGYDDLFIVNPYGYAFRELTASSCWSATSTATSSRARDSRRRPPSTSMPASTRTIPRAKVAFHTHMPYATALSMTEGEPLIFAGQTALKFYGRTAVDRELQRPCPRRARGRPHRRRRSATPTSSS